MVESTHDNQEELKSDQAAVQSQISTWKLSDKPQVKQVKEATYAVNRKLLEDLKKEASSIATSGNTEEQHLTADQAVKEIDGMFSCDICLWIVDDPQECAECNWLFCGKCMKNWLSKNSTCPRCRETWTQTKGLNRFVKQTLSEIQFKCTKCAEQFSYETRKQHWTSCGTEYKCTQKKCDAVYQSLDDLLNHWQDQCMMISVECTNCSGPTSRESVQHHSCEQYFKESIRGLIHENNMLKSANSKLKMRNELLERQQNTAQPVPISDNPHNLTVEQSKMVAELSEYGLTVNKPQIIQALRDTNWNMEAAMNVLLNMQALLERKGLNQSMAPQMALDPRLHGQPIACMKGHQIVHYQGKNQKQRSKGLFGGTYQATSSYLICNACRKNFNLGPDGSYSCQEPCDFDLCKSCATCDKGHIMVDFSGLPTHYHSGYSNGVLCSRCQSKLMKSEISSFNRCNECKTYDTCRKCAPKATK